VNVHQVGPIYRTKIITIVQCMYDDCHLRSGSGGLVEDFNGGAGIPQRKVTNFLFGRGIGQHNVGLMYRKNVALWCGCSILVAV